MVKRNVNEILKAHEIVHQIEELDLSPSDTLIFVEALSRMPLRSAHIDVGKLVVKYSRNPEGTPREFLERELASAHENNHTEGDGPKKDVVLYGFGRIGRLLCDRTGGGKGMRLRAIVVRKGKGNDLQKRAGLLRFDSVHGAFDGVVKVHENSEELEINGQFVKVIYANSPETVDYTAYGIENAVVADNTGVWRDEEGLSLHLQAGGVSQALLTAPAKGDIKNIVHGINHGTITEEDALLSAASCTTNAIAPVLKAIND